MLCVKNIRNQWNGIPKQYKNFILWSFISNITATTQNVLANHSMLNCIDQDTTGNLVTTSYIGKDVLGQLGGFMYLLKTSKNIDTDPTKTVHKMSLIQQTSFFVESATPLVSHYFLPIAAISNIGTNVAFTGFGAINTKVIQKLSPNNIGETYTKITAINTVGSSIGMALGIGLTAAIPDHSTRLCIIPILGVIRTYSLHKSLKNLL